jgi:hypothetical protein
VLLLGCLTSSHGLLFGVQELCTMTRDNLEEKLQLLLIQSYPLVVLLDEGNSSLCMVVDDHYSLYESRGCLEVFPGSRIGVKEAVFQVLLLEEPACVG